MGILPTQKWSRILVLSAYILIAVAGIYLFFGRVISLLAPFLAAFFIGWLLCSPAEKLCQRTGIKRKLLSFFLVLTVIFFIGFVAFLLANQLISEAQRLFERLSENSSNILSSAAELLDGLGKKFPFIYEHLDREVINGTVTEVIKNLITSLSSYLASALTAFVTRLPDICLFFVVFVIASFYFAIDFKNITAAISKLIPCRFRSSAGSALMGIKDTLTGYIKAYSVILLVTFAQLFVGFLVLRVNYATTLAMVIALLDMLPVIGTGTVLIPWAVITMLMGDMPLGIGLIILFGIITVIREVIEPKLIGSSIGMHPLLTLIAMYAGYRLFGLWGILLLPPLVNLAKTLFTNYTPKDSI
ncbi:MAG: sporulation integral membrane protein YtvI [Clostridia bacterium]|nr:sporulation integral membrane protein YtvI [Clostridia bacterium]MBQ4602282.1 sporulation integral membrane protein YtvI [Clostridia bacterium]